MFSMLVEFEGYRARVERDREGMFYGRVLDIEDIINFKATSIRQVEKKFMMALEVYFERCKEQGIAPQKPNATGFYHDARRILDRPIGSATLPQRHNTRA